MDSGGSFTEGGLPEDHDDGSDELPSRGWLPPDDRLWLHPSEMAKRFDSAPSAGRPEDLVPLPKSGPLDAQADAEALSTIRSSTLAPTTHRRSADLFNLAAIVVAVAMVVLMADHVTNVGRATPTLTAATTSLTTAVTPTSQVQTTMTDVRSSLVGLVVTRHGSKHLETGVAMAPGNLVVTTVPAVAGATSVIAVTSQGRQLPATVVGSDRVSGVSVIRVQGRVDPAHFATTPAQTGELAMTECLCQSTGGGSAVPHAPTVVFGRIEAVGVGDDDIDGPSPHAETERSGTDGAANLIDTVEADYAPLTSGELGSVLVNGEGQVAGVLAGHTRSDGRQVDVFVPGWLAEKVAHQLVATHRVVHGWLGVTGSSERGGCGAVVDSVIAGAPAQHALVPGDVVVSVDGRQICNWSELQASLYVVPPEQTVDLSVDGPDGSSTVAVRLSPSPS